MIKIEAKSIKAVAHRSIIQVVHQNIIRAAHQNIIQAAAHPNIIQAHHINPVTRTRKGIIHPSQAVIMISTRKLRSPQKMVIKVLDRSTMILRLLKKNMIH